MEKISELIEKYCPDGVDCRKLLDLLRQPITDGPHETPKLQDAGIPFVSVESIHDGIVDVSKCRGYISKEYSEICRKKYKPETDDVYMVKSASVGRVAIVEENTNFDIWSPIAAMKPNSEIINPRFLFYSLQTKAIQKEVVFQSSTGSQPNLSMRKLERFEIPLPPLCIQQEIVLILDSFTSLITNLETELAARQKQYEYYRNKLLTFNKNDESVEWKTLGEIGTILRGNGLQKSDFSEDGVGCIHYGQIYTRLGFSCDKTLTYVPEQLAKSLTKVEPGNLVIACTSENVEDVCKSVVWLGNEVIVTGGHACVFKHNENPKYIGYCFITNDFFNQKKKYAYGAKVIDIKTEKLAQIIIPVPSRELQDEIVSKLDCFESLIANIKQEIEARKKQYEYYREQLLTFE